MVRTILQTSRALAKHVDRVHPYPSSFFHNMIVFANQGTGVYHKMIRKPECATEFALYGTILIRICH